MIAMLAAVAMVAGAVSVLAAGAGDTTGYAYLNVAWPATYTNGTFYSTSATGNSTNGFDRLAYSGKAKLILAVSGDVGTAANTNTALMTLQDSDLAGNGFTNVSSVTLCTLAATAKVYTVNMDLEKMKRYLRIGVTQTATDNTNCAHMVGAVMVVTDKN